MKIVKEFSRFAHRYNEYNVIQKEVAKKLSAQLERKTYETILDIGAGDGAIYNNLIRNKITFESFTALDLSSEMLALHPDGLKVNKLCLDFNENISEDLEKKHFDILISSSALQWSCDLQKTLKDLTHLSNNFHFAFFTSGTFKTLHQTANITSPIYSKEEILIALNENYVFEYEELKYVLEFPSVREMLQYIKNSGVSSGTRRLSYKDTKRLMLNYPLDYLEFEVLFVKAFTKN